MSYLTMMKEIEKYAEEYNIPIIQKEGLMFLLKQIKKHNVVKVLEIGTAIGYSAINMALMENCKVTTIEKDSERYFEALKNIKNFKLENKIDLILGDALEINIEDKYDLIFIDAAKGKYIQFFEKYKDNLNDNGLIITDNISFHGLVDAKGINMSDNLKQLVEKIKNYIIFLKDNEEFKTKFYKVGDGLSVSIKK